MPININNREGLQFSDVIRFPDGKNQEVQARVEGNLNSEGRVVLPDGKTVVGEICIRATTSDGGRPARTFVFRKQDGTEYPFGEQLLSAPGLLAKRG